MKSLSSSLTFFYKYVFITIWSGGFGTLTIFFSLQQNSPKYDILIAWIIGTLFLYAIIGRLKKVQTDGHKLYISNYLKSVEVDISQVLSVSGSLMLSPELVWLRLRQSTELGQTIIFMPPIRFSFGFTKHPMAQEIQALIDNKNII